MKKLFILFLVCSAIGFTAKAQSFRKFKVGLGLGYASASGKGASGGVLVYMEPAYRISDEIQVGLRMETALIARGVSEDLSGNVDAEIAAIGSYTLNGQYYFSNGGFRPFAGAGFGLFSLAAMKFDSNTGIDAKAESKIGFYPRVGFDAGHFTLSLDYNLIPATKLEAMNTKVKNSYLGFRLGFFIGGGKK